MNFKLRLMRIGVGVIVLITPWQLIEAKTVDLSQNDRAKLETQGCRERVEDLTVRLLQDLPNYANRVVQRTQKLNRQAGTQNYIIIAGKADFEPLDLPKLPYNPGESLSPKQIFFTVLERQYIKNRPIEIKTYHWLFLTQTNSGWHLVSLFSRFGNTSDNPPTPPQETSDGIIGRAIQTWLRDCRAQNRA